MRHCPISLPVHLQDGALIQPPPAGITLNPLGLVGVCDCHSGVLSDAGGKRVCVEQERVWAVPTYTSPTSLCLRNVSSVRSGGKGPPVAVCSALMAAAPPPFM